MHLRNAILTTVAVIVLALTFGCEKVTVSVRPPSPVFPAATTNTVARIHWSGKRQLGVNAGAYYFMRLWQLPESRMFESQTLDKLAAMPWVMKYGKDSLPKSPVPLLRPLLDDAIQQELYFQSRIVTNGITETVLAVRLEESKAGLWRTNLVAVIASLTGIQKMDILDSGRGWALKQPDFPNHFELARVGEWTVLGIGLDHNDLLKEVMASINSPAVSAVTNADNWFEAELDLARLNTTALSALPVPNAELPRLSFGITGDGGNLVTRGKLVFPKPHGIELKLWNIPTNLVQEPLTSFVAIRGIDSLSAVFGSQTNALIGLLGDEVFAWSTEGTPLQVEFARPVGDVSQIPMLFKQLQADGNKWLSGRSSSSIQLLPQGAGLFWSDIPSLWSNVPPVRPFLTAVRLQEGAFLYGASTSGDNTNSLPPPNNLFHDVVSRTNLIYYDWEVAGPRLESDFHLGQAARAAFNRKSLPPDGLGALWLKALVPRITSCTTALYRSGPAELSFVRKSTVGLNAIELSLLVDNIHSLDF
jgi:hypothetical protein